MVQISVYDEDSVGGLRKRERHHKRAPLLPMVDMKVLRHPCHLDLEVFSRKQQDF